MTPDLERRITAGAAAATRIGRERTTALALLSSASQNALRSFQSAFDAVRFDDEVARLTSVLGPSVAGMGLAAWIQDQLQFHDETVGRMTDTIAQASQALLRQTDAIGADWLSISRGAEVLTDGFRRSYEGAFADMARMKAMLADATAAFDGIRAPGTFLGDYLVATDADAPEEERMVVLDHMQEHWFRSPIHPRRWDIVQPELARRATANGTSTAAELRAAVPQSLFLALHEIDDAPIDELLSICRTRLANLLTDELAGPGWRQRQRGVLVSFDDLEDEEFIDDLDVEYQAEVRELYEKLWAVMRDVPTRARNALLAKIEGRALTNAEHQAMFRLRGTGEFQALREAAS